MSVIFYYFILRFDGDSFTDLNIQTKYDHGYAFFSKYDGNPFIVGNDKSNGVQTEILVNGGTVDQSWNTLADYPFGERFVFIGLIISILKLF